MPLISYISIPIVRENNSISYVRIDLERIHDIAYVMEMMKLS